MNVQAYNSHSSGQNENVFLLSEDETHYLMYQFDEEPCVTPPSSIFKNFEFTSEPVWERSPSTTYTSSPASSDTALSTSKKKKVRTQSKKSGTQLQRAEIIRLRQTASELETQLSSLQSRQTIEVSTQDGWKRVANKLSLERSQSILQNKKLREQVRENRQALAQLQASIEKSSTKAKAAAMANRPRAAIPVVSSVDVSYRELMVGVDANCRRVQMIYGQAKNILQSQPFVLTQERDASRALKSVTVSDSFELPRNMNHVRNSLLTFMRDMLHAWEESTGYHRNVCQQISQDSVFWSAKMQLERSPCQLKSDVAYRVLPLKDDVVALVLDTATEFYIEGEDRTLMIRSQAYIFYEPLPSDPDNKIRVSVHIRMRPDPNMPAEAQQVIKNGFTTDLVLFKFDNMYVPRLKGFGDGSYLRTDTTPAQVSV